MEPKKQLVGVVVRADGTVPFDPGLSSAVKSHIIEWLLAQDFEFDVVPEGLKIKNWN